MSANFKRIEYKVQNDLQYVCSSIRYLQMCVDETYSRNAWPVPLPRGHAQTLPASGPPFDILVPPPAPSRHQLLLKIQTFRKSDPFFVDNKKGERDIVELFGNFYFHVFIYVLFSLDM